MSTETTRPEGDVNVVDILKDTPLLYVEALMGIAVGPFVSKVVLGVENGNGTASPKIQLTMPTNVLHMMAQQLTEVLGSQENQNAMSKAFKEYQDSIPG